MTSADYLAELRSRLSKLPPQEIEQAMNYYEEYFAEAGPGEVAGLISRLGSPAQVASTIISDYAIKDVSAQGGNRGGGIKTMWIVIIAVLASPLAIPLAIALLSVAFSLLIALFSIYLSLFVSALALVVVGVIGAGVGIVGLFANPLEAMALFGASLICLSVGVALGLLTIKLCQLTIKGITWIFAKILGRKGGQ